MSLENDQGRCRMVPPPGDPSAASCFDVWLNKLGDPMRDPESGCVELTTAAGRLSAQPGDWIIRTIGGELHLARLSA